MLDGIAQDLGQDSVFVVFIDQVLDKSGQHCRAVRRDRVQKGGFNPRAVMIVGATCVVPHLALDDLAIQSGLGHKQRDKAVFGCEAANQCARRRRNPIADLL